LCWSIHINRRNSGETTGTPFGLSGYYNKPLNSVEEGLPYAINRSHEWRKDAVLTDIEIISEGKQEIEGDKVT